MVLDLEAMREEEEAIQRAKQVRNVAILKPGQTLSEAIQDVASEISGRLAPHFSGWNPASEQRVASQASKRRLVHRKSMEELEIGSASLRLSIARREEELEGGPSDLYWNPVAMRKDILELVHDMNPGEICELMSSQVEYLNAVQDVNSNLDSELSENERHSEAALDCMEKACMALAQRIFAAKKLHEDKLESCQDSMIRLLQRIKKAQWQLYQGRQTLLRDKAIEVTDVRKAQLEERRRQELELRTRLIEIKVLEEEEGGKGMFASPQVQELQAEIAACEHEVALLKAELARVSLRVGIFEKALHFSEILGGKNPDELVVEVLEEAKRQVRTRVIVPMMEQLKKQAMPPPLDESLKELNTLEEEKKQLETTLARLNESIELLQNKKTESQVVKRLNIKGLPTLGDESAPLPVPMTNLSLPQAKRLKAGLWRELQQLHHDQGEMLAKLPRYAALLTSTSTAFEALEERWKLLLEHLKTVQGPFVRDLRSIVTSHIEMFEGPKDRSRFGRLSNLWSREAYKRKQERGFMEVDFCWQQEEEQIRSGALEMLARFEFTRDFMMKVKQEMDDLHAIVDRTRWFVDDYAKKDPTLPQSKLERGLSKTKTFQRVATRSTMLLQLNSKMSASSSPNISPASASAGETPRAPEVTMASPEELQVLIGPQEESTRLIRKAQGKRQQAFSAELETALQVAQEAERKLMREAEEVRKVQLERLEASDGPKKPRSGASSPVPGAGPPAEPQPAALQQGPAAAESSGASSESLTAPLQADVKADERALLRSISISVDSIEEDSERLSAPRSPASPLTSPNRRTSRLRSIRASLMKFQSTEEEGVIPEEDERDESPPKSTSRAPEALAVSPTLSEPLPDLESVLAMHRENLKLEREAERWRTKIKTARAALSYNPVQISGLEALHGSELDRERCKDRITRMVEDWSMWVESRRSNMTKAPSSYQQHYNGKQLEADIFEDMLSHLEQTLEEALASSEGLGEEDDGGLEGAAEERTSDLRHSCRVSC